MFHWNVGPKPKVMPLALEDTFEPVLADVAGSGSKDPGQAERRVEIGFSDADLGALRHCRQFGGANVRPPPDKIGGDSYRDVCRRNRDARSSLSASSSIGCGAMPSSTASAFRPWFIWLVSWGIVDSVWPSTFSRLIDVELGRRAAVVLGLGDG